MLVNWKIKKCDEIPEDLQAPDYIVPNQKYWFFRYFPEDTKIDVIDITSFKFWEKIERNKLHFYIIQTIKALFKIKKYDVVLSHGMPSGILLALFRRFFRTKAKHIVFDIGSFNSAAKEGKILRLNQFASKSIDGIIYHSSKQIEYYKEFYPWIVDKCKFIHFGTDLEYFRRDEIEVKENKNYILSIGYSMRDYDTLLKAFEKVDTDLKLRIIGNTKIKTRDSRVEIIGPIDKRELNKQIQNAKFCVLPLEDKNFSFGQMTLLQQMYYKKLVITAEVPSVIDYVKNEKTTFMYKSKDFIELKNKIEYAIKNNEKIDYIGENARKDVIHKYNEENMAKKILEFLNKIINKDKYNERNNKKYNRIFKM